MDGKGRAIQNILIKRLWRTVKYEKIYLNVYQDRLSLFELCDVSGTPLLPELCDTDMQFRQKGSPYNQDLINNTLKKWPILSCVVLLSVPLYCTPEYANFALTPPASLSIKK